LGAGGIADIGVNQANWSLVKEKLEAKQLNATGASISKILTTERGFAANTGNQVAVWKRDKELRERKQLCQVIAQDTSIDPEYQQQVFQKFMTSDRNSMDDLREKARVIEERRAFRAMPTESLKAVVAANAEQRREELGHKLPPDITAEV